jgi:hypothetical protein
MDKPYSLLSRLMRTADFFGKFHLHIALDHKAGRGKKCKMLVKNAVQR